MQRHFHPVSTEVTLLQRAVRFVLEIRIRLIAAIISGIDSTPDWATETALSQTAALRSNEILQGWLKHSTQADPSYLPACYSPRFGECSAFLSNFIAEQRHCLKIELCLKWSSHPHFIRYLSLSVTIVQSQLQIPRIVETSETKLSFTKDVQDDFLNPVILHFIPMDSQRCSENLTNFLIFELAEG